MNTYKFPDCNCEFEIIGHEEDGRPRIKFDPDISKINLECQRTWDLISDGRTVGIFQLEKQQRLSRKFKPRNIFDLAILLAIIRPSCLESGITEKVIKVKNGDESISYFHPALEPILKPTYSQMVFQEQAMKIAQVIANFSLQQADVLRKAIGKKLPEVMVKVKKQFLDGCKKTGIVNTEEAEEIFNWIEKAQRYQFNACLGLDTIVETPNGYKTLAEIEIGDEIKTINDEFTEVVNVYDNGVKELYEVELESGKKIKCTMEHKFLCEDNKMYPLWEILDRGLEIIVQE